MNLVELIERYRDEDKCRDALEKLRWPNGIECPRCGGTSITPIQKRGQHKCNSCEYHFSVKARTIFHDSHLPLWKWFITVYLMCESKKGVSANQIKRTLGVAYKTAWYLCHRIRAAMAELNAEQLRGTVEVDETLIGGVARGMGRGYRGNKSVVVGAIQRDGKVRLQVVDGTDRETLHGFIRRHSAPDTELIITDEWGAYKGIADKDTRHETVNHSAEEWARGDIHTNNIEGVWSLLNRSVVGTFHKISAKHLDAYLDELEWRFNNRENPYLFRDTLRKLLQAEKLEFRELVAE